MDVTVGYISTEIYPHARNAIRPNDQSCKFQAQYMTLLCRPI